MRPAARSLGRCPATADKHLVAAPPLCFVLCFGGKGRHVMMGTAGPGIGVYHANGQG